MGSNQLKELKSEYRHVCVYLVVRYWSAQCWVTAVSLLFPEVNTMFLTVLIEFGFILNFCNSVKTLADMTV